MSIRDFGAFEAIAGRHRARAIRPSDLPECIRLLRFELRDPDVTALWGDALNFLFAEGAIYGAMVEDLSSPQQPARGCGLGFFLSPQLLTTLERCPSPELDRIFAESALHDRATILRPNEIGHDNATTGLHLFGPFAFDDRIRGTDDMSEAWQALAKVANFMHCGYHLASMHARVTHGNDLRVILLSMQGRILNSAAPPESLIECDRLEAPVIVGVSRHDAVRSTGLWVSTFFVFTPPRFRFAMPEQALLRLALVGMPDPEIASELDISIATIKKRWENIYDRVTEIDPDLLQASADGTQPALNEPPVSFPDKLERAPKRGPEKRYRLLRYLVNHLEELRPYHQGRRVTRCRSVRRSS